MFDYFTCPHCGAAVPSDASACPECGSDEETGWSEDAAYGFFYDDEPEASTSKFTTRTKTLLAVLATLTISAYLAYKLPWGVYLIPVLFLIVGVAYYVTQRFSNPRYSEEKQLYRNLVQKARGDTELVERLIEYERRRSPGSDRLELLLDAIYRWERDNR
jgi:uncharacterized membrane protein YvbJ